MPHRREKTPDSELPARDPGSGFAGPETFENVSTMTTIVFDRIKAEAMNWVIAGAKHLGVLISGE
jgi:hypothetical protein